MMWTPPPDERPTPPMHRAQHPRMVWVLDGKVMCLRLIPGWLLQDDGFVELEGRKCQWFPAKEL